MKPAESNKTAIAIIAGLFFIFGFITWVNGAFGLAASSFFPAILLGIFSKRINKEGAISGMLVGVTLMLFYMLKFKFGWFGGGTKADWWFGISPEGFGSIAMIANFVVTLVISSRTPAPSKDIQELVANIRKP